MGVGQIVDQNSDEKDGCEVLNMLNSRLGLWSWWWKKDGCFMNSSLRLQRKKDGYLNNSRIVSKRKLCMLSISFAEKKRWG